ncbi:MAG: AI-2E family transporter [Nanoarchaeota archaeon]|nr:AI-2E family transporter [Nanoarchaeota archaeon]
MAEDSIVKKGLVGAIIAGIFILAFFIIKPIIIPLIFGGLFAYIFNPIYKKLYKSTKRKNLSAAILMAGITAIVTIPLFYFASSIIKQAARSLRLIQNYNFGEVLDTFLSTELARTLSISFDTMISQVISGGMSSIQNVLFELPSFILQFAVFLFTFFFVVRDSQELKEYAAKLSPFSKSTEERFLKELRGITNAIVFGQVLIGIMQGLAVGVAFYFLGVPNALLLTGIAAIISVIPILGSWLVWLPVSFYLLASGLTFQGIFLIIYGVFFVSSIDNVARPYFLAKQSNLPIPLSIVGTIGGLYFFGLSGLILGPLVFAYALIIIEFYKEGKLNELFRK